ncbi:MAG: hypothetical protein AB1646_00005 [Thermodesulfobacteriota bacterium]
MTRILAAAPSRFERIRAMDESWGIMVVLGAVGLLVSVAAYRFVTQRKQLSSGRTIGRFQPERRDGAFVFENLLTIP